MIFWYSTLLCQYFIDKSIRKKLFINKKSRTKKGPLNIDYDDAELMFYKHRNHWHSKCQIILFNLNICNHKSLISFELSQVGAYHYPRTTIRRGASVWWTHTFLNGLTTFSELCQLARTNTRKGWQELVDSAIRWANHSSANQRHNTKNIQAKVFL